MLLLPILAAACFVHSPKPPNYDWAKCGLYDKLIARDDGPGVGLDSGNHKVPLLDSAGHVEKVIQAAATRVPLSFLNNQLMTTATVLGTALGGQVDFARAGIISSGGLFFLIDGDGVRFMHFGGTSAHSFPHFDASSAIGINRDANLLVWLDGWYQTRLTCSNYVDMTNRLRRYRWVDDKNPTVLGIRKVGDCQMIPSLNDIAFISDDAFVFIGKISPDRDEPEFGRWQKGLVDLTAENFGGKVNAKCELFATDTRTLETVGFATFSYQSSPEPRGPSFGRMQASFDSKYLFIQADGKILRIPSADILSKFTIKMP